MKICYIARHYQINSNDDEGAIAYALQQLGHEVICLRENQGHEANDYNPDLVLFHMWDDVEELKKLKCKKVFWYFDLVDWPDPTLDHRNKRRREWIGRVTPHVDFGFCTDGDWVKRHRMRSPLHILRQGADERMVGEALAPAMKSIDILFTGTSRGGGEGREEFVRMMHRKYGHSFVNVAKGVHQQGLKELIGKARIVVAPSSPVTDHYWSNRVYLTLGFGGFLLHPYCHMLTEEYTDDGELAYYRSWNELHNKIEFYLKYWKERDRISLNGLEYTLHHCLYRHRCEQMLRVIGGEM